MLKKLLIKLVFNGKNITTSFKIQEILVKISLLFKSKIFKSKNPLFYLNFNKQEIYFINLKNIKAQVNALFLLKIIEKPILIFNYANINKEWLWHAWKLEKNNKLHNPIKNCKKFKKCSNAMRKGNFGNKHYWNFLNIKRLFKIQRLNVNSLLKSCFKAS